MQLSHMTGRAARLIFLGVLAFALGGCGRVVESAGQRFGNNLSAAMMEHEDPQTVAIGAPAYLLLLDALVRQNPESTGFRMAASKLNSAYVGGFVTDPQRAAILTTKALEYGFEALCLQHEGLCDIRRLSHEELQRRLAKLERDDVPLLYTLASSWASWVQAHSDDFGAVTDLPRVQALMERSLELDEHYQDGAAHLYLGVIAAAIPAALGGRPDVAREHFEKAIALSGGHNLMAKVYYAKTYARGQYDRELHDRLLNEVVEADPKWPAWTLSNKLAQKEAEALLESADEYF